MADFSFINDPIARDAARSGYELGKADALHVDNPATSQLLAAQYEKGFRAGYIEGGQFIQRQMAQAAESYRAAAQRIESFMQYVQDYAPPRIAAEVGRLLLEHNNRVNN